MTPPEPALHPSVATVRDPNFDFGLVMEMSATCAQCGRRVTVREDGPVGNPCDRGSACGFSLQFPNMGSSAIHQPYRQQAAAGIRGAVEDQPDMCLKPRNMLTPSLPPRDALEWRARRDAVAALAPELAHSFIGLPIGWLGLVELAAHGLHSRGAGEVFRHRQSKEKFGTARIYISPTAGRMDDPAFRIADAVVDWAEAMTGFVCARDGTMDGRLGRVGGWAITLGERAWADVEIANGTPGAWRHDVLGLYPGWDRDDA